jgi:hypothetical protein
LRIRAVTYQNVEKVKESEYFPECTVIYSLTVKCVWLYKIMETENAGHVVFVLSRAKSKTGQCYGKLRPLGGIILKVEVWDACTQLLPTFKLSISLNGRGCVRFKMYCFSGSYIRAIPC